MTLDERLDRIHELRVESVALEAGLIATAKAYHCRPVEAWNQPEIRFLGAEGSFLVFEIQKSGWSEEFLVPRNLF